jgi:hypothetical protein
MYRQSIAAEHAVKGQDIVDGTSAVTGSFSGMLVVADTVVSAMKFSDGYPVTASKTWANLGTIPAGVYLPGHFRSITLTSGKVILIRE